MNADYCGLMADAVTRVDTAAINNQVAALIEQLNNALKEVEAQEYYASKAYVDGKHVTATATLTVSGWSSSAPYTQTVTVAEVEASDHPHVSPVYSDTLTTAQAQEEAWNCVSKGVAKSGAITFYCFADKPETAIPIQVEVNR